MVWDLYKVIRRLNGKIEPLGKPEIDEVRLDNLIELNKVIDRLITDIFRVSQQSERKEGSIRNLGSEARDFLVGLKESLEEDGF